MRFQGGTWFELPIGQPDWNAKWEEIPWRSLVLFQACSFKILASYITPTHYYKQFGPRCDSSNAPFISRPEEKHNAIWSSVVFFFSKLDPILHRGSYSWALPPTRCNKKTHTHKHSLVCFCCDAEHGWIRIDPAWTDRPFFFFLFLFRRTLLFHDGIRIKWVQHVSKIRFIQNCWPSMQTKLIHPQHVKKKRSKLRNHSGWMIKSCNEDRDKHVNVSWP